MDRRAFLNRSALLLAAAAAPAALAACGSSEEPGADATGQAAVGATGGPLPTGAAALSPTVATYELLTGGKRSLLFGLRDLDNVELKDAEVEVYLRSPDGEITGGPYSTEYLTAPGTGLGLYRVELELTEPGTPELVAVEGDRYGAAALNVVTPQNAKAPVPGTQATVVKTPTEANELGYQAICTQDPPCGMHEISLDDAIKAERPIMLIFATPEFCQTVVCGPAVETVDAVRNDGDWGDTAWIHVEIYSEFRGDTPTLGKPVKAWELPSEPWLFSIGPDGQIAARLDGPMVTSDIEAMAEGLTA